MNQTRAQSKRPSFLQSALLVDDRVWLRGDPSLQEPSPVQQLSLVEPAEESFYGSRVAGDSDASTGEELVSEAGLGGGGTLNAVPMPDLHDVDDIDSQKLVEAFADRGISCATLAPRTTIDTDLERVMNLARHTDIVILDWYLRSPGELQGGTSNPIKVQATTSRDLVHEIIKQDTAHGGRLRLLCIYTGAPDLVDILKQLHEVVQSSHGDDVEADQESLRLLGPSLRIAVVPKPSSKTHAENGVSEAALAELLIEEFQGLADGLLRDAALVALASIRNGAHRLLLRFPASVDPAFLSHRALVGLRDADEWVTQLVTDEMAVIAARDGTPGGLLDDVAISRTIDQMLPIEATGRSMLMGPTNQQKHVVDIATARRLFNEGREAAGLRNKHVTPAELDRAASLTLLLMEPSSQGEDLRAASDHDDALAVVSCLARDAYLEAGTGSAPVLGLGSILSSEGKYFICMQPLCDTVRLKKATQFPLLPLRQAVGGDRFDITLRTAEAYVRLRSTDGRLRDIEQHIFSPELGVVRAAQSGSGKDASWIFRSSPPSGSHQEFVWAGDLRLDQASRAAARLMQSAARPGLMEFEYQRVRSTL